VPVEIREVVLRAKIAEGEETPETASVDFEELKHDILVECEERIREALRRQSER